MVYVSGVRLEIRKGKKPVKDVVTSRSSFPSGRMVENSPASARDAGDLDLIPGLGRPPGEGNGNPLRCSCLENPRDRGAWRATVHGVTQSQTRLSN